MFNIFVGTIEAYDKVWFFGDDFMADSFNQYFINAQRKHELYTKVHYDISSFVNKSFSSHVRSVLVRIKGQVYKALSEQAKLPKFCIFMIDDDILKHFKIDDDTEGIAVILNMAISWLFREIDRMIKSREDQLTVKTLKEGYPQIFWLEAPQHMHFDNNLARRKLNSVVQNETSNYDYFKIIRVKKHWDPDNRNLFFNRRFSAEGLMKYWQLQTAHSSSTTGK